MEAEEIEVRTLGSNLYPPLEITFRPPTIPFPLPNSKGFSIWISKRGLFVKNKDLTKILYKVVERLGPPTINFGLTWTNSLITVRS